MSRLISMLHSCPMTLIVSLPHNDAVLSQAAFEAGADAVKVHCNLVHNASGNDLAPSRNIRKHSAICSRPLKGRLVWCPEQI